MNNNKTPQEFTLEELELDLDQGKKIIRSAEKLGADTAEVFMVKGVETGFSIEKDSISFATSSMDFGIGIRVISKKRLGFGYCTKLDQTEYAVKNALSATKLAKVLDLKFATEEVKETMPSLFDRSIFDLTIEEGLELTMQLINSSKEIDPRIIVTGGGIGYGGGSLGIITSSGIELQYSGTSMFGGVSTLIKDKAVSTGFEFDNSRRNTIHPQNLGKKAAELAVSGQNPRKVEPGKYSVIFSPHALCELLEFTIIPSLYGEPATKGETFYSNKLGSQVANPELTFYDDSTLEEGMNSAPFDDEGTKCQKTTLVENGILKNYLFDQSSALETDHVSTGNAMRAEGFGAGRSFKSTPKTKAYNFVIEGKAKPLDKIISEQDNALLVRELLGSHTANQGSGDFSVNSPSLFKIQHGEITGPAKQVMIVGNMPEMMKNITFLGDDYKNVNGGLTPVFSRIPSIAIDNVKIV